VDQRIPIFMGSSFDHRSECRTLLTDGGKGEFAKLRSGRSAHTVPHNPIDMFSWPVRGRE